MPGGRARAWNPATGRNLNAHVAVTPRGMTRATVLLLLSCLLLAGCSDNDDGGDDPPTSTSTSGAPATGTVAAAEILSAPEMAPAGGKATVCWTVSGTGRVPHVAIHWDNVTHATEAGRSFSSYDLGASYPNNRTGPDSNGYQLMVSGARFCTAATMPESGSIFVVAHAMDSGGPPGMLSTEREIRSGPPEAEATIRIQSFAYTPPVLTVRAGETVSVENMDSTTHTVTGNGFNTGNVAGGTTDTFSAPMAPGTYPYTCAYHATMQGTLEVTAP